MQEKLYIAYGSNLNRRQMQHRCRTARVVGTAEVQDHELLFRGGSHAVATIEPAAGKSVPVLLWSIRPGDEKALDLYEGWPRFYEKRDIDIQLGSQTVSAMAYVMTEGHAAGTPSQSYLATIAEGYQSAGFNLDVLQTALRRSVEVQWEEAMDYVDWLCDGLDASDELEEEMEELEDIYEEEQPDPADYFFRQEWGC